MDRRKDMKKNRKGEHARDMSVYCVLDRKLHVREKEGTHVQDGYE